MKSLRRVLPGLLLLALGTAPHTALAAPSAVKGDRVNVRARAALIGEVIAQLRRGERVEVLEQVTVSNPKEGEPAKWIKIVMPANTPVWVHRDFVKDGRVVATRLNLRVGPGERFSVVGRIPKNTKVQQVEITGEWIQIETPPAAYAFVAAQFVDTTARIPIAFEKAGGPPKKIESTSLEKQGESEAPGDLPPAPKPEQTVQDTVSRDVPEAAETVPADEPGEPSEAQVKSEPETPLHEPETAPAEPETAPAEPEVNIVESVDEPVATQSDTAGDPSALEKIEEPLGNPEDVEVPNDTLAPESDSVQSSSSERVVGREGIIRRRFFRSPHAPSRYTLVDVERKQTINYLFSSSSVSDDKNKEFDKLMKKLRNRRVIIRGIELVDPRWPKTPLLDIRSLKSLP